MRQDSTSEFTVNLRAELALFREFHLALQQEQTTLIGGDIDGLLLLAPIKSELIDKLSTFSAERDRFLAAAGYENTPSGLAAWFNASGVNDETRELWAQLLKLARETEETNRTNGTLIETHLRHNQQALAALQTAANPGSLYGANGQLNGMTSGRHLGKV